MNGIVFVFSVIISVAAFWVSIKFIRLYVKVKKWDRVKAVVFSKEVFLHPKTSSSRSPYGIRAEYSFHVKDVEYRGHHVYLIELVGGQVNHMKSTAENRWKKIADTMTIYVNPANPQESVMYCEGMALYLFVFLMGILSLLIGLSKIL